MTIATHAIAELAIAETGDEPAGTISIDLARKDIVYACEIAAALRGYEFSEDLDAIAVAAIADTSSITRVVIADPLYVATTAFATGAADVPATTRFNGRLAGISFRRSINNGADFSGVAVGDGELTIDNGDGRYDAMVFQVISGREIVIKIGTEDVPYGAWRTVFRGTARGWTFSEEAVHVELRDDSYRLGSPMQETLYAGSGGSEGGDALKDKRKPLLCGYAINFAPPQVDAAELTYQLHDGAVDVVASVRDRGVPLSFGADRANYAALIAAAPAAGSYDTCLAEGWIKLGSVPDGTVTVTAATYRSTGAAPLSTIVRGILEDRAGITRFDTRAFNLLLAAYPGDHGTWLSENDNSTVADVVSLLLGGVLGYVAFRRDGSCTVGVLDSPEGDADHDFSLGKVIELTRERLPSRMSPPPWRYRLLHDKNHTPQTDLAGAADQVWAQPGKVTAVEDADVRLDHLLAQDGPPVDSYMIGAAAADAEAVRQHDILKEERPLRRTRLPRTALTAEIGDLVQVGWDRWGGTRRGINVEDAIEIPPGEELDGVELLLYG